MRGFELRTVASLGILAGLAVFGKGSTAEAAFQSVGSAMIATDSAGGLDDYAHAPNFGGESPSPERPDRDDGTPKYVAPPQDALGGTGGLSGTSQPPTSSGGAGVFVSADGPFLSPPLAEFIRQERRRLNPTFYPSSVFEPPRF